MPQVDVSIFLPIIMSLFKVTSLFFAFFLVNIGFGFVTRIKLTYVWFNKIKQIKNILKFIF